MVIEPGNNVNSTNNAASKTRQGQARASDSASVNTSNSSKDNSGDNVSLSNTGQSLSRLEAAVANVPEVDAERIAALKTAIEKGNYQVNAYNLAGKMLAHDDL